MPRLTSAAQAFVVVFFASGADRALRSAPRSVDAGGVDVHLLQLANARLVAWPSTVSAAPDRLRGRPRADRREREHAAGRWWIRITSLVSSR